METAAVDHISLLVAQAWRWPLAACSGNPGSLTPICCCAQLLHEDSFFFQVSYQETNLKSGYVTSNRKKFL